MSASTQQVADSAFPLAPSAHKNRAGIFPAPHPRPPATDGVARHEQPVASAAIIGGTRLCESAPLALHEQAVIDAAMAILRARLRVPSRFAHSPGAVRELAMLHFAQHDVEGFAVMFLDARNGLIAIDELFTGSLMRTFVFPREVVRAAMRHNAASVILMHNHPFGLPDPSPADKLLTNDITAALSLVDVFVVDHLIVAGDRVFSFAERGLL